MKATISLFSIILFIFILNLNSVFALPDSCLALYCPNDGVNYNPDLIMIDTCKDSPTYGDWFQSGTWTIGFKKFFLRDSIDFVKYGKTAQLNDIDSVNFPQAYSAFKVMVEKFGEISLKRDHYACVRYTDSSYYEEPCMIIYFNFRNRTKDVEDYLNKLPEITFVRMTKYPVKSNVPASCLSLLWRHDPENGYYNACSIKKDTCKNSPTYGDWYIRGTLLMRMKEYIFSKLIPEAHGAYVEDIDSVKYLNLRDSFLLLEKRYGRIQFFRDPYECNNIEDEWFVKEPCLDIDFPKYNRLEDVSSNLGRLSISYRTQLKSSCYAMTEVNEVKNNSLYLQPNPCYDKLKLININNQTSYSTKIEIYNSFGQRTGFYEFSNELNEIEIDVSHLSSGIYLIKINNSSLKFIKLE